MPTPRQVTWAKFRVVMAVLASIAIFSVLAYLLTGGTLLTAKATVFIYIPDATALAPGSPVRVNGVDVGRVQNVALSGSNQPNRVIRVTMEIEEGHLPDIPVDSFVQVSTDNVVGDKFVDITRGRSAVIIQRNAEIAFKGQPELLKTLDLTQFEQQIRTVEATLDDIEQGRSEFGRYVLRDDVYNDLLRYVGDLQKGLRATAGPSSTFGSLVYTDQLYRQIQQPLAQLDASLARIQAGQGDVGRLLRDDAQYLQLRDMLADLRKTVASLQSNQFLQSDEQYADWNRMLTSLIQNVETAAANPLLATSADYENLAGMAKQLRGGLRDFRQDPRKYLRFKLF
jgi:phospholipid/cholesterol/gamma-HCH transport system substrate-binding protein